MTAGTFTWLNKQGVQHSSGFVVQFTGRFSAEYREGPRTLTFGVEDGGGEGNPGINVNTSSIRRWDNDAAEFPSAKRQQIIANIRDAMRFQGLDMTSDE